MLKQWWEKTKVPLVIVIDGLNENTSLPNFENHIIQSIEEWLKLPFLKIIMTTRCELFKERFGKLSQENMGETFSRIDMSGPREEKFKNRIFEGYLQHFNVHIMRESLLDSTYELLANDTLLLRFFCEVNREKEQVYMYDVYKYALFNTYYENKKKEIKGKKISGGELLFDRLINRICKYMIDNKTFHHIPKDILNISEIQLLDLLLEGDIIFKEDQVVKKGFVNECIEALSFTFDEFRDYCITRYLLKASDATQSFPVIWDAMCNEHWSILEGVEKYLFFLARTSASDILPIIEKNENFPNIYWKNVWNLEDEDITEQDIADWRAQFRSKGPYRRQLIQYLLVRRNKAYFKKVTIDLLFEIMDELSDNPGEFDEFIRMFFPILKVDRYNQEIYQENCVFYCNQMIKALIDGMDADNKNIDYYTYLKMSIYLYGIMPKDFTKLWVKALTSRLAVLLKITDEFLEKEYISVVVKTNLEAVYETLSGLTEDDHIREMYSRCQNREKYQYALTSLNNIWQ
jgi:hypothetical protein